LPYADLIEDRMRAAPLLCPARFQAARLDDGERGSTCSPSSLASRREGFAVPQPRRRRAAVAAGSRRNHARHTGRTGIAPTEKTVVEVGLPWGTKPHVGTSAKQSALKGAWPLNARTSGRQQTEADRATAVAVVNAVDHRRQPQSPLIGSIGTRRSDRARRASP
jgi:hypothetical protein